MNEQYRTERSQGVLGRAKDKLMIAANRLAPGFTVATTIYYLREGDYGNAAFAASLASVFYWSISAQEKSNKEDAWRDGATTAAWIKDIMVRTRDENRASKVFGLDAELKTPAKGEPYYISLDGKLEIVNKGKLLEYVGVPDNVLGAVSRFTDPSQRDESVYRGYNRMEYLRQVQAVLRMMPDAKVLFEDKPELLEKMNNQVAVYERKYKEGHKMQ